MATLLGRAAFTLSTALCHLQHTFESIVYIQRPQMTPLHVLQQIWSLLSIINALN